MLAAGGGRHPGRRSRQYERVLLVGGRAFMVYPYTDGSPLPEGTELLHLSPDPALARAHLPGARWAWRATRA